MIARAEKLFGAGRHAAASVLTKVSNRRHQAAVLRTSRASLSSGSRAADYDGLTPYSLALSFTRSPATPQPSIVLVLPALDLSSIYAGVKTALEVGLRIAEETGRPLRVIPFRGGQSHSDRESLVAAISNMAGRSSTSPAVFVQSVLELTSMPTHDEDLWVVTHWTTAHAAQVAVAAGLLWPDRIVYLVQDYEPGFSAWSTHFAAASATYHAGFHLLVNSTPVAAYLRQVEGITVAPEQVFHPQLDLARLAQCSSERLLGDTTRILFYGRPSKPRNMFDLGVASLKALSRRIPMTTDLTILSAGEAHQDIALPNGRAIRSLGKLSWDHYYSVLSQTDIVFNLQMSPHPSHLPLDALAAGASAVSNDLGDFRSKLHHNLHVAPAEPGALAATLEHVIRRSTKLNASASSNIFEISELGNDLTWAVHAVLKCVGLDGQSIRNVSKEGWPVSDSFGNE